MTVILVVLVLAAVAALLIIKLLRGSLEHPTNLVQLMECLEPVNTACFRHLASETDDVYLKKTLPRKEYRHLHKLRLQAIYAYYAAALQNVSVLLSYAELLSRSNKPELVEFGQQLSPVAIQLRLALMGGLAGILACYFLPLDIPRWRRVTELYEQIGHRLGTFCETHAPDLRFELGERFPL